MKTSRRYFLLLAAATCVFWNSDASRAQSLPIVSEVELQPLAAQVRRVAQALEMLGAPLDPRQQA